MKVGIWQIALVLLAGVLLFGGVPGLLRRGAAQLRGSWSEVEEGWREGDKEGQKGKEGKD